MRPLFWVGLVILILGVASFFISVPRSEKHGVTVGGASVGVEVKDRQKLPPAAGAALIVGGVVLMAVGGRR